LILSYKVLNCLFLKSSAQDRGDRVLRFLDYHFYGRNPPLAQDPEKVSKKLRNKIK
jgi:hypothetical protein